MTVRKPDRGAVFRKARERLGLTQLEAAIALDVTPGRVSVWETTGQVSQARLDQIRLLLSEREGRLISREELGA